MKLFLFFIILLTQVVFGQTPINLKSVFPNSGLESGKAKWVTSGGTFTTTTTGANVASGKVSGRFVCSSIGNYVETTLTTLPLAIKESGLCQVAASYKEGTGVKLVVRDASTSLFELALANSSTYRNFASPVQFTCPTSVKARFECTSGAGSVYFDDVYGGERLPVQFGHLSNSTSEGGESSPVREESCRVTNSGTPTVDTASGLCAGWISSVALSGGNTGRIQFSLVAGVCTSVPVCNVDVEATDNDAAAKIYSSPSTSQVITQTSLTGTGAVNLPVHLSCKCKR